METMTSQALRSMLNRASRLRTRLQVCEVERAHVTRLWTKLRPYDPANGLRGAPNGSQPQRLDLTAARLAHAVVKAEFLKPPPHPNVDAAAFLLSVSSTLDWRPRELRLYSGASRSRADFAGTSLAGRVGQGMALLAMDMRSYAYHAHYQRDPGKQGPDFVVQNGTTRAFVEAKGAFVAPRQRPDIKAVLRDGLAQLKGCKKAGVTKSFVVATFLREVGDTHPEPSLVALVDPDHDDDGLSESPDWVIRENYAGWLRAMGLHDVASDLRGRIARERGERVLWWQQNIAGSEFLLMPIDLPFPLIDEPDFWPWPSRWLRHARCVVLGLECSVIERIRAALANPGSIMEESRRLESSPIQSDGMYGSVMSDGTLMGTLPIESLCGNRSPTEIEL